MQSTNNSEGWQTDRRAIAQRGGGQSAMQTELIVPMPAEASMQQGGDYVGLGALVSRLWRRRWLIAGVTAVGLVSGLAVSWFTPRVYRARTTLQLEGFSNDTFYRDLAAVAPQLANAPVEHYLQNQLALLRSDTLARRVADRLRVETPDTPPWTIVPLAVRQLIGQAPVSRDVARVQLVQRAMTVRPTANSEVLEVYFTASTPEQAVRGASAIASEFIALNSEHRSAQVDTTTKWLGRQTSELKSKLEQASQALQSYADHTGLVFAGPGEESTVAEDRMRKLGESLAVAQTDRAAKQAQYEAAAAAKPEALPAALISAEVRQMEADLQNLRRQLAEQRTIFTPAHQKVKSLEAQITQLEAAVRGARNEAVGKMHTEYLAASRLEQKVSTAYAAQLRTLQTQARRATRYNLLKKEVSTMQQVYDAMLQKEKEAGMAAALRATNVRVIDAASQPAHPFKPNLPLNTSLRLAFGAVGGLLMAVLLERPNVLRCPGDFVEFDIPELGVIPSAREDREHRRLKGWPSRLVSGEDHVELVTWEEERSLLSESFRATLASILFGCRAGQYGPAKGNGHAGRENGHFGQLLVITSVEPMEGKTTVASNLAIALAETNRRVLLIDADMRRPRIHSLFDMCNDWGLSDLIQDSETVNDAPADSLSRPTRIPNLWVLPTGPATTVISKLLYSPSLERLLERQRMNFDLVLVDSPPIMPYCDARVFGKLSDGVVMVVRANRTCRESLRAACMRLKHDQIPVLGTVLNDCVIGKGYHGAYSNYYRDYSQI